MIFGRNNLVSDAPISRLDLLICRNTLMYFTAETQARACVTSTSRCASTALLMLGKSEMMISHRELFAAVDLKKRIFRQASRGPTASRAGRRRSAPPSGRGVSDRAGRDAARSSWGRTPR